MSTLDSKILREIGLEKFNGTVCTTFNGFKGYTWGPHSHTSEQEYVVDGEPSETFKLSFTGKLCNVTVPKLFNEIPFERTNEGNSASGNKSNVVNVQISQSIRVVFPNNVHEVSKDYRYEVRVIAETPAECQAISFGVHTRSSGCLEIERSTTVNFECVSFGSHIRCFHFIVRRFASKMEMNTDRAVGIGEMLLNNQKYSDASIVVGNRIFSVHKDVLGLKSDVFKSMFTHRMTENEEGIVKIDDFDAEIIEEMILYIYTNKTKNLKNFPRELFEVAHKYQILDLIHKCKEHMIFNLNFGNAVDVLDVANIYDLHELKENISTFIKIHEEEMVHQDSYQEFLYRQLSLNNVTSTLLLCTKYNLDKLRLQVFDFVKENKKDVLENEKFMELFDTQASLMRDIVRYLVLDYPGGKSEQFSTRNLPV